MRLGPLLMAAGVAFQPGSLVQSVNERPESGPDPKRDRFGKSAVAYAAGADHSDALEALLQVGAGIDIPNVRGQTALSAAIANHKTRNAILLVDSGADPSLVAYNGMTPLLVAINAQERTVLQSMIARGADIDREFPVGRTSLVFALERRDVETVKLLLESGAQVDRRLRDGDTPLLFVAKQICAPYLVRLLVAHGADVNARDAGGLSALEAAARQPNCGNAEAIREAGAARE
jgi:ankyrin repeat protein